MTIALVNFGIFIASFCMFDFAYNHFSKNYAGIKDLAFRLLLALGIIISCLLMPVWIQKNMLPEISPFLMVVGMPLGLFVASIHNKMVSKGSIKWSGKK